MGLYLRMPSAIHVVEVMMEWNRLFVTVIGVNDFRFVYFGLHSLLAQWEVYRDLGWGVFGRITC